MVLLDVMYLLSLAAFIYYLSLSYDVSVPLQSVVVIVVYSYVCIYSAWSLLSFLNMCVDVSIKFGKILANKYIYIYFPTHFSLLSQWDSSDTNIKLINIVL